MKVQTHFKSSRDPVHVGDHIFIEEKVLGSKDVHKIVVMKDFNETLVTTPKKSGFRLKLGIHGLIAMMKATFLPDGYPNSVPKEYTTFQIWNIIQDSCSYLRGILSTRAILEGFGVGRSDITAVQATMLWILRDGASMLGGLLFTSFSSANFGQNVKSWRLFADIINNVGITLEMLAPIFRTHFLLLVCIASICKSLCGIAAAATGAAIAEHWGGERGNIADVLAKNGAQHTFLGLLGLSISIPFAEYANADNTRLFSLYAILTTVHIYSNIQAMKTLALRSLNVIRYRMLVSAFVDDERLRSMDMKKATITVMSSSRFHQDAIAKKEPIFSIIIPKIFRIDLLIHAIIRKKTSSPHYDSSIKLWCTPSQALNDGVSEAALKTCLSQYQSQAYTLIPIARGRYIKVNVCYREDCTQIDIAKGIMESYLMQSMMNVIYHNTTSYKIEPYLMESISLTRKRCDEIFPVFWDQLARIGWDTKRVLLLPKNPSVFNYITEDSR